MVSLLSSLERTSWMWRHLPSVDVISDVILSVLWLVPSSWRINMSALRTFSLRIFLRILRECTCINFGYSTWFRIFRRLRFQNQMCYPLDCLKDCFTKKIKCGPLLGKTSCLNVCRQMFSYFRECGLFLNDTVLRMKENLVR